MKIALGSREMTEEAAQQCAKNGKELRALVHTKMIEFNAAIFAWPCYFGQPSRALVDYHLEMDGIPLHDAVGVNCRSGATTENQGEGA